MDSENHTPALYANSYDIDTALDVILENESNPLEAFHSLLQTFTATLPRDMSGSDVIREVATFSRRATDLFIANEFEISYA